MILSSHHVHGGNLALVFIVFLLQFCSPAAAQPSDNRDGRYPYTEQNFRPSMTVTIIVLAIACIFIAFISFYIRRCSHNIHIQGGSIRRTTRTRPAPQGLQASVIETFPTFLYSVVKGLKIGKEVLECAVCLNEFEDDETLRMLPKCDHVFHPECIDAWLSSHTTCPVCRADLVPSSEELTELDANAAEAASSSPQEESDTTAIAPQLQPSVSIRVAEEVPIRSKSIRGIFGRFPRSHSTGHMAAVRPGTVVQPGNHERFTLKLPEDVRRQILNGKLNRTTSCVVYPRQGSVGGWTGRSGSLRSGNVNGNGQSGRLDRGGGKSDRWGFLRATSFLWRNNSGASKSLRKGEGSAGMGQSSSSRPPV